MKKTFKDENLDELKQSKDFDAREKSGQLEKLTDEELALLAQEGNSEAEQLLVIRFMGLVRIKARPYFLVGADKADLIQEGAIGLCNAIRDYDESKQVCFHTFAEVCINRQMISAIKAATRLKHSPLNNYISLDKPAYSYDDDSGKDISEILVTMISPNPEELALEKEAQRALISNLEKNLTELEINVLFRFLDGQSYGDIAKAIGRTQKGVDNALQRVKKKIIKLMNSRDSAKIE